MLTLIRTRDLTLLAVEKKMGMYGNGLMANDHAQDVNLLVAQKGIDEVSTQVLSEWGSFDARRCAGTAPRKGTPEEIGEMFRVFEVGMRGEHNFHVDRSIIDKLVSDFQRSLHEQVVIFDTGEGEALSVIAIANLVSIRSGVEDIEIVKPVLAALRSVQDLAAAFFGFPRKFQRNLKELLAKLEKRAAADAEVRSEPRSP